MGRISRSGTKKGRITTVRRKRWRGGEPRDQKDRKSIRRNSYSMCLRARIVGWERKGERGRRGCRDSSFFWTLLTYSKTHFNHRPCKPSILDHNFFYTSNKYRHGCQSSKMWPETDLWKTYLNPWCLNLFLKGETGSLSTPTPSRKYPKVCTLTQNALIDPERKRKSILQNNITNRCEKKLEGVPHKSYTFIFALINK